MRCIHVLLPACVGMLFFSGCTHLPPEPLDLIQVHDDLRARTPDVVSVREYVDVLASGITEEGTVFDLADGLDLFEAQFVALWYNPDVRLARLEANQSAAVAKVSGRWKDPILDLAAGEKEVEGDAGGFLRDAGDATRSWINAASLSITIPLSGRPGAEKQWRESAHATALLRAAEAEWAAVRDLREAWLTWSAANARADLLRDYLDLLTPFADTAASLANVGELSPSSARLFNIEHLRVAADLSQAAARATEARMKVLQHLGLVPDAPVELKPALPTDAPVAPEGAALANHPHVVTLKAAYQEAEDRLRLELRKQYPDITLSPTYTDEEDETALTLGLGFPVPVWHANRAGIAEAAAVRDVARAQVERAYLDVLSEAAQAETTLAGSRTQRGLLVTEVAPAVDEQLAEARALLDLGEIDIVLLYEALTQAFAVKQQLLDATLAEARAAARLAAVAATSAAIPMFDTETDQ